MPETGKFEQASREVQDAEQRLRDLDAAMDLAGSYGSGKGYEAGKEELERQLADAQRELITQEQLALREASSQRLSQRLTEHVKPVKPIGRHPNLEQQPGVSDLVDADLDGVLDPQPANFDPSVGPGKDAWDRKEAQDRAMQREHAAIDDAVRAEEQARQQQAESERAQAEAETVREQIDRWRDPEQRLGKMPDPVPDARTEPLLTDEEFEKLVSRTTGTSSHQGEHEADRAGLAAEPEENLPERQAHPPHGGPDRQAHPPHGAETQRKREAARWEEYDRWKKKKTQKQVVPEAPGDSDQPGASDQEWGDSDQERRALHRWKTPLLVAGIGVLVVAIGATAVAARPPQQAQAPAAIPVAETLRPPAATAVPAQASPAARTAAPIGATIVITPYHSWAGSGGSCTGRQTLEPKTVANPPVGESVAYEWDVTWPSCAASRSWGIDYPRETFSAANTLFRPKTTYSISPLERGTCAAGMCRQPMVVIVKNEGS